MGLGVNNMTKLVKQNRVSDILIRQLIRSSTSVCANYRSALRARSNAEFISELKIAEEEADETGYWLEFLIDSFLLSDSGIENVLKEAKVVTAILSAASITAQKNNA